MPRPKPKGRKGIKNHPRQALPMADALQELDARSVQSVRDAARILGQTEMSVRNAVKAGTIGAIHLGRLVRIPSAVLKRLLIAPAA